MLKGCFSSHFKGVIVCHAFLSFFPPSFLFVSFVQGFLSFVEQFVRVSSIIFPLLPLFKKAVDVLTAPHGAGAIAAAGALPGPHSVAGAGALIDNWPPAPNQLCYRPTSSF